MDHTRHADLFRAEDLSVTLIGAGGIGASTALALAKMGVGHLTVWDDDTVSEVNLPTQLHRLSDLGRQKVQALNQLVFEFSDDTDFVAVADRVTPAGYWGLEDYIVISAVDSIKARKGIWQVVRQGKVRWYLDSRMAAEEFHLFCVDMHNYAWYEQMLAGEDDSSVPELSCTAKATIYTSFVSAGRIGLAVKRIATGQRNPRVFIYNIAADHLLVQS